MRRASVREFSFALNDMAMAGVCGQAIAYVDRRYVATIKSRRGP